MAVKTGRGALLEVTKIVTNNDAKGEASSTPKGKEKETSSVPEKSKPFLPSPSLLARRRRLLPKLVIFSYAASYGTSIEHILYKRDCSDAVGAQ